jgi:hexosaminidase
MSDTTSTTEQSIIVTPIIQEDEQADERPFTIPALKEWHPASTAYAFNDQETRIVLDRRAASQLHATAVTFADDLLLLTGIRVPLTTGSASALETGDIFLTLDSGATIPGHEGYLLEVSSTLTLRAPTEAGIFYATRTALQLLTQDHTIPGGSARDWPDYPERSLMVDMGRKYFSVEWLENHIRELAYLKYNYFHFHLSDNYGFRLESERHPEIVSPEHYSKDQIRALLALARKYHITIVPEIDMPGHMDTTLAAHPSLQLTSPEGKISKGDIDLANEEAYQLVRDLLEEFLPLFPGPYWHIGADEYIMRDEYEQYPQLLEYAQRHYGPQANIKDTYLGFVNWANEIVKAHGKITRAWNDGLYGGAAVTVADDIVFEHWLRSGLEPQEIVDLNLSIMNGNADHLYYVLGNNWRARPDNIYHSFEHHIFHGPVTIDIHHPCNLGAKLHVWCDNPNQETEEQIAQGITCSLRSLAQKNWGSRKLVQEYERFLPIIVHIGHAPGFTGPVLLAAGEATHHQTGVSLGEAIVPLEINEQGQE